MLKRLLLCLVTSITCYSYFDTSNAMESNSESNQNEINSECILCRANPEELFNMKEKSEDYESDEENDGDEKEDNEYDIKDINNDGSLYGSTTPSLETIEFNNEFLNYYIAKEFFASTFLKYAKMWEKLLLLQKDRKDICNKKHYKISECYDFHNICNVINKDWEEFRNSFEKKYFDPRYDHSANAQLDDFVIKINLDDFRNMFDKEWFDYKKERFGYSENEWLNEFYTHEERKVKKILEFLLKYFQLKNEYNSNDYLLGKDKFHNSIILDLCGIKLLDDNDIKNFCGSRNLYEALIVSVMRFFLSQASLDSILFKNKPIAGFDLYSIASNDYDGTLLHDFVCKNNLYAIPLVISQLNNASYVVYNTEDSDYPFKTEFDCIKCKQNEENSNLNEENNNLNKEDSNLNKEDSNLNKEDSNLNKEDSNLNKVLNSFEFFKLKFNFKLDAKELVLLQAKPESIPEFLHFIFNSANNDLRENAKIDSEIIYYNWCNDAVYTLCKNAKNLESCELFKYIDQSILKYEDFLQNLLNVAKFYCSNYMHNWQKFTKNDLLKLITALLNYYKNKLPENKYNLIEQCCIEFLPNTFESANNDLKNNKEIDPEAAFWDPKVTLHNVCNEIVYTLCKNAKNLESCELFKCINQNIQNNKDFLQNILNVAKFYSKSSKFPKKCSASNLIKLKKALLNYYKDKLSKDKYMIIEQFNI